MKEAEGLGEIRFMSFNIRIHFACFIQLRHFSSRFSLAHCLIIEAHNLGPPVESSIPCKWLFIPSLLPN